MSEHGSRTLIVEGGAELRGLVVAPPDKSITHRALFFGALGEGETLIHPLGGGRDNRATVGALRALGVSIDVEADEASHVRRARVVGAGSPRNLKRPAAPIDCMNSGTTMRVLSGIVAASGLEVTLTGDDSLSSRPMSRLSPLEAMGAAIDGRRQGDKIYPPITIRGAELRGTHHRLEVASAQVKTALILAGLWANGESAIEEPMRSRDHTERMLRRLGAPIREREDGAILVQPIASPWRAGEIGVAPDLSSAAFFIAAALITGSEALIVETGANPTRAGVLEVFEAMGARIERESRGEVAGEPVERIRVLGSRDRLRGVTIEGARTLRAIDEIPLIAGVAAFAEGRTVVKDAGELRVKESDRLAAAHALLTAFGATVEESHDGLVIDGDPARLRAGAHAVREVEGRGDHRIAMTGAIMGLAASGETRIHGAEHIEVSFPGFERELSRLGALARMVD
jgi:3-phosphoshikimate 1-carboxyvinyltransferase